MKKKKVTTNIAIHITSRHEELYTAECLVNYIIMVFIDPLP